MTTEMQAMLRRRADRAETDPDVDRLLVAVRELAERHRRRRRNALGATSGVVVVLGLVALLLMIAPGAGPAGRPSAGAPARGVSRSPELSWGPATPVTPTARDSAFVPKSDRGHLVIAAPTPAKAPLAVTLAPAGWRYIGYGQTSTVYGPKGTDRDPSYFVGKLALLVGERTDQHPLPLTLARRPARIDPDSASNGGWVVTIAWSTSVQLNIQVPGKAGLSRAEVVRLANSLQVRDVRHRAKG